METNTLKRFGLWEMILSFISFLFFLIIFLQENFYPQNALGAFMASFFALIFGYISIFLIIAGLLTYKLNVAGRDLNLFLGFALVLVSLVFRFFLIFSIPFLVLCLIFLIPKKSAKCFIYKNKFVSGAILGILFLIIPFLLIFIDRYINSNF